MVHIIYGQNEFRNYNFVCRHRILTVYMQDVGKAKGAVKNSQNMGFTAVLVLPILVVIAAGVYYLYTEITRLMSKSAVWNKVVVITDAVSGMGKECSRVFHAGGARVILCGKSWEKLEALYDTLNSAADPSVVQCSRVFHAGGARVILCGKSWEKLEALYDTLNSAADPSVTFTPKLVVLDFSDIDAIPDVTREILECYGCVDVLISNASMKVKAPVQNVSLEMDKRIMDTNYFGPITLTKGLLPSMISRRSGQLVLVNSIQGRLGVPFRTACWAMVNVNLMGIIRNAFYNSATGQWIGHSFIFFYQGMTFTPKLVVLDFSDIDAIPDVTREILECYGCVDVLISNASMKVKAPVQNVSLELDKRIMDTNYFGPITLTKDAASKHAAQAFFDCLRAEVEEFGISVSTISPTFIRSYHQQPEPRNAEKSIWKFFFRKFAHGVHPEEVANEVLRTVNRKKKEVLMANPIPRAALYIRSFLPGLFFAVVAAGVKDVPFVEEETQ
ncbi:UNVERIFIED_CONTAM: hypothetical protein FKN15_022335 [Acipenser sinensis]